MKILSTLSFILIALFTQAQTAPIFAGGNSQNIATCNNIVNNNFGSLFVTIDPDTAQTLTYTIVSNLKHGTVSGFPKSIGTGNGGSFTPANIIYTPTTGYTGKDSVVVSVSDGVYTTKKKIIITVDGAPLIPGITGIHGGCMGSTTQLSNSYTDGLWSSANNFIATINSATGLVTPTAIGTTTINYTVNNSFGCSTTVSIPFIVDTTPAVQSITGNTVVCVAGTTILSNTTTGGVWSCNNTSVASINSNTGLLTGLGAGAVVIKYTYTNASGCSNFVSSNITINASPAVSNNVASETNVCVGSTTIIRNSTVAGVWLSSNTSIATVNIAGVITGVATGNANISYTVTNAGGCTGTASNNFTISIAPVVQPIVGDSNICLGNILSLSNATIGGVWKCNDTTVAKVSATGLVTPKKESTNPIYISYNVTGASGCTKSIIKTIFVNGLPYIGEIQGVNIVCVGSQTLLTNSVAGGVWISNDTAKATVNSVGVLTGVSTGATSVKYILTSTAGCSNVKTFAFSVTNSLNLPPTVGASNLCTGTSLQLTNAATGGAWSSSDRSIAVVTNVGIVYSIKPGVVTINYAVGSGGCSGIVGKNIKINPSPVIDSIVSSSVIPTICIGRSVQFSNATPGGIWASSNASIISIDSAGKATGMKLGDATITYSVTNSFGCSQSVFVNATTVVFVPVRLYGKQGICLNSTTLINNSYGTGTWSTNNPSIITITDYGYVASVLGTANGTAKIFYTVINAYGCVTSDSVEVTVSPKLHIAPIVTQPVCFTKTTTFTCATSGGKWYSSDTVRAKIDTLTGVIKSNATGSNIVISYVVQNGAGCADTSKVTINAYSLPNSSIGSIQGSSSICIGDSKQYTNSTAGGVWWTPDSTSIYINSSNGKATGIGSFATSNLSIRYSYTSPTTGCTGEVIKNFISLVSTGTITTNITGLKTVCVGSTITVANATPGGKWFMFGGDLEYATVDSITGVITALKPTGSRLLYIYYIIKTASSCPSFVKSFFNTAVLPTTLPNVGNNSVCVGAFTALSNGVAGGVWSSSDTTIASVNASGIVSGINAGNCIISYKTTNYANCIISATTNFVVKPLPIVAPITASIGFSGVCVGSNIQLNNSTVGGVWSISNTDRATISNNGLVTGIAAGGIVASYTVVSGGCTATSFLSGNIYALPVVAPISGSASVCLGNISSLSNDSVGGVWSSSNSSIVSVENNGKIKGMSLGNAIVTYIKTSLNSCITTVNTSIAVNPLPLVNPITNNLPICVGASNTLNNATNGGYWKVSDTTIATIQKNTGSIKGTVSGIIPVVYIVTDGNGCSDSASTIVTVNPLPIIAAIVGNTAVCVGNTTNVTNTTLNGIWTSANASIATINTAGIIAGLQIGNTQIRYKVTNIFNCVDSVAMLFNVSSYPNLTAIIGDSSLCVGASTLLAGSLIGGVWSSNNTNVGVINSVGKILGIDSGVVTITYTVKNNAGCSSSINKSIRIVASPLVEPIIGSNDVCIGNTAMYSSATNGGVWGTYDSTVAKINSGILSCFVIGNTEISYTVTNSLGCSTTVKKIIKIRPLPTVSPIVSTGSICAGTSTFFANNIVGGIWTSSNGSVATINTFTGEVIGIGLGSTLINYIISDIYGCTNRAGYNLSIASSSISGNIINTTKTKQINNVKINVNGTMSYDILTSGKYTLNCLSTSTIGTIKPTKNNDIKKNNGVSSIDVILTQNHILNKIKLNSPYKLIAADVNNNKSISNIDVIFMKRLILGIDTTFTGNRLWAFVDSAYQFPDTTNPFPYKDSISFTNLTTNKTNQTFIGVKLGDVNYDWNPALARGVATKPIEIFYNDINLVNSDLIRIPIRVNNFNEIVAMQYTLGFNDKTLEYVGIENNYLKTEYSDKEAKNGLLTFLWNDARSNPKTLEDGTVIFELVCKKKQNFETTDITINDKITAIEAYDKTYELHNIVKGKGSINTNPIAKSLDDIFIANPNPTKGLVNVMINAKSDKTIQLILTDIYGKVVAIEKLKLIKGENNLKLNLQKNNKLAGGIYILKTIGLHKEVVKQIVIID